MHDIARTRRTSVRQIAALVRTFATGRTRGFTDEPAVNVGRLNLALDRRYQ